MSKTIAVRVLALAISLSVSVAGVAAPRIHTVRGGESVSSIAKRYYGMHVVLVKIMDRMQIKFIAEIDLPPK